ncbi:MAG: arginine--tRNA ligase [Bacillota bacterium]|uniref:Arginine--tRNA ligase n=1 Tax=Thermanaerosceptrum fracticalcis TaxID=1712410 RepID=A0A7G6E4S8_THEFR|nr:arginine--tRNA ligase [Thermanaerosceptrum fracticalcis]QNB47082.1 arginine--tRNA ligase [Thermanaerosceptrum fracticalcis]
MSIVAEVRHNIRLQIEKALEEARAKGALTFESIPNFVLEVPREKAHGDFATNVAMLLTKQAKLPPRVIAEHLVANFSKEATWVDRIEIAGPGFINFHLGTGWLYAVMPKVIKEDTTYGNSTYGHKEKVQVEFVSANPTGLLHMGNARGAALGDTLSNLLEAAGFDVTREFYINDAGNQIENFGKSLEARYLQLMGEDIPFPEEGYHGEDIITTVKNIIAEVGDKYLSMDSALRREFLIQKALEEKLGAIRNDLARFGVEYDVWFSEQTLHDSGAIAKTIKELQEKGYIYEKEGALWFKSTLFGDEKDEVVVRSNGIPTYFAADIAYHKNKFERGFQKVINIWGADHHGHVARMKGAVKAVGYDPDRLHVILMQLVRLFRGGEIVRMSKRSGQYVTLSELMDEVGKDAARYFFVMRSPDSHLDFDLDLAKAESSENPVYYVQYAHARINSILKASGTELPPVENVDFTLLKEEAELELIRKIADLPEEIVGAAVNMEPHRIARYAHDLASLFHSFYNSCRVLTEDEELRKARLCLVDAARITLRNVLHLLGLSAPERM